MFLRKRKITIKNLLLLLFRHQAYCDDPKMHHPSRVNVDFVRGGWRVADYTFSDKDRKDFYSKYLILRKKVSKFANGCSIYCQESLVAPLASFICHLPTILWPECPTRLRINRKLITNHLELQPSRNTLMHTLTVGVEEFSLLQDAEQQKKTSWEIIFDLHFDKQKKKFFKNISIKAWPTFEGELKKTMGKANTKITEIQAQKILIAICLSSNKLRNISDKDIPNIVKEIKEGTRESKYQLKEMLKELDQMLNKKSLRTRAVELMMPSDNEFIKLIEGDRGLLLDDKISFLSLFKREEKIAKLFYQFLVDPQETETCKVKMLYPYFTDSVFFKTVICNYIFNKSTEYQLSQMPIICAVILVLELMNNLSAEMLKSKAILRTPILFVNNLSSDAKIEEDHRRKFINFMLEMFKQHYNLCSYFFRKDKNTRKYLLVELNEVANVNEFAKQNGLQGLLFG